jgi:hypothetical protein
MQAPAQVLVIVTVDKDAPRALDKVGAGLGMILASGRGMDIWPLSPVDKLLPTVRAPVVASVNAVGRPASWGACAVSEPRRRRELARRSGVIDAR